jgi:hypothetical protein
LNTGDVWTSTDYPTEAAFMQARVLDATPQVWPPFQVEFAQGRSLGGADGLIVPCRNTAPANLDSAPASSGFLKVRQQTISKSFSCGHEQNKPPLFLQINQGNERRVRKFLGCGVVLRNSTTIFTANETARAVLIASTTFFSEKK